MPDEKTLWLFRENITITGLVEDLFVEFKNHLASKELIFNEVQLVYASFAIAPRPVQYIRRRRENKKKAKDKIYGIIIHIKNAIKILTHAGQRKITKHFMAVKTM